MASFKEYQEGIISDEKSKVNVYVVPTNEELMIVRDTYTISKVKTKKI